MRDRFLGQRQGAVVLKQHQRLANGVPSHRPMRCRPDGCRQVRVDGGITIEQPHFAFDGQDATNRVLDSVFRDLARADP
jgi:hypothetical protein